MTLQEAKIKLISLRKRQNKLRKEIDSLREFIFSKGSDPDRPKGDLSKRNRAIYRMRQRGFTGAEIGSKYNLSATRILGICKRIDGMIRLKRGNYKFYLLK